MVGGRNSMAMAALGVLRGIYVRFKKAVNSSRTGAGSRSPTILDETAGISFLSDNAF